MGRRGALEDLLLLRRPIADAVDAVRRLPFDSDIELVMLTRPDAVRLLDAFIAGLVTARDCEAWANAVEGRDDIGLETVGEDVLRDFLFELSTPEASRALTRTTAEEWRQRLG